MAFDRDLADRVRELISAEGGLEEKSMFGGLAFLINGNIAVAVSPAGGLMVRVRAADTEELVTRRHVEPMTMAGRETAGWVRVTADGVSTRRRLAPWVARGVDLARSLPAKHRISPGTT